jgi:hypothetical protein
VFSFTYIYTASSVKLTLLNLMMLLFSELPDLEGCHSGMNNIMLLEIKDNMMLTQDFIKICSTLKKGNVRSTQL